MVGGQISGWSWFLASLYCPELDIRWSMRNYVKIKARHQTDASLQYLWLSLPFIQRFEFLTYDIAILTFSLEFICFAFIFVHHSPIFIKRKALLSFS